MNLILVDPNPQVCEEWNRAFQNHSEVQVVHGRFEELANFDCMVSAANSFGLMDGGVDLAIIKFFGIDLMGRVQKMVIEDFRGEQPVGTSVIVETLHPKHPYIAHTPTMRVPKDIRNTDNVYSAMFSMLLAIHKFNKNARKKIEITACPGLGTSFGKMNPRIAANQMELAYRNFKNPPKRIHWPYALTRQNAVENSAR